MVFACRNTLLRFYDVSFVHKHELDRVALWRGTQAIDELDMQAVLGKKLDQEEVYCRMGDFAHKIRAHATSSLVLSQDLLDLSRRIPNVDELRFISLRPVPENAVVDVVRPRGRRSKQECLPGRILGLVELPAKRRLIFATVETASPAPSRSKKKRRRAPAGDSSLRPVKKPRYRRC
jgi:hypothetical protein